MTNSLQGKKGLVVGIANDQSIAWGCARAFRAFGAELAVTYLNEKARPHVEPLAQELEAPIVLPLLFAVPLLARGLNALMLGEAEAYHLGIPVQRIAEKESGKLRRMKEEMQGKVIGQVKGEKIIIYKYKSKKNFDRKTGHRQNYTKVEITAVG